MNKNVRNLICFVLVLCMFIMCSSALAGTSTGGSGYVYSGNSGSLEDRLAKAPAFKFWQNHNGIGYGNCPVYTAPSMDAYRCADGKASCDTNHKVDDAGFISGWLLVRYETNNGGTRVGYIPPQYVQGFRSEMSNVVPEFDYIPAYASDYIYVTDNINLPGSSFGVLDIGESFYILGKYTYIGDWWYIECTIDGQVARGFIDRETSYFNLGETGYTSPARTNISTNNSTRDNGNSGGAYSSTYPSLSDLGTPVQGEVVIGYGTTGARKNVRQRPDTDSDVVSVVYPDNHYPYYAVREGSTGKDWYYIWVDDDSTFGWISSGYATVTR